MLGDKRVQSAVEGRFCDSAISVREAALELVGRHIASHPDVGLKVSRLLKLICAIFLDRKGINVGTLPYAVTVY